MTYEHKIPFGKFVFWGIMTLVGLFIIVIVSSGIPVWMIQMGYYNFQSSPFYWISGIIGWLLLPWALFCAFKMYKAYMKANAGNIANATKQAQLYLQAASGNTKTKYCLNCGASIPSVATYCPTCGKQQVPLS